MEHKHDTVNIYSFTFRSIYFLYLSDTRGRHWATLDAEASPNKQSGSDSNTSKSRQVMSVSRLAQIVCSVTACMFKEYKNVTHQFVKHLDHWIMVVRLGSPKDLNMSIFY